MKYIVYQFPICIGADENKEVQLYKKVLPHTDAALDIAKREAYNSEYAIEDDGRPIDDTFTQEQRIAELEEALALLLSGVTE